MKRHLLWAALHREFGGLRSRWGVWHGRLLLLCLDGVHVDEVLRPWYAVWLEGWEGGLSSEFGVAVGGLARPSGGGVLA